MNIFNAYVYNIRMDIIFQKDSNSSVANKKNFKTKLIEFFKNYNNGFYFFLFLCFLGLVFFISSLWENQFTTLFGGDYTAQQLPFYTNGYDDWWHFFKTGEFRFFSTNTYLGASNMGANTFYYLFDPFFLPILLCPRAYIAQGMAILTIFKIATAGMFFRKYMRVMGASDMAAKVSALAYAFCGWMAWFLWFNHMTEIMIVFPIMLWGVERVLRDKKPWLLMFSLFLMGVMNYFFLIGMGLAAFFYALFRYFQRLKLNNWKTNLIILGLGFIGFLAGLLLACCLVYPNILYSMDAPRAANSSYLDNLVGALKSKDFKAFFEYIFSWKKADGREFKHFYPLASFVFPCASCRGTPLAQWGNEWYDNCATNTYSFLPMLLLFTPAFIKAMKEKKWSVIVATVLFLVALETPFAYYLFFGFTAPYGRWELFFVTSFITFTGLYIDKVKDEPIWTDFVGYGVAIVAAIGGGICSNTIITYYKSQGFQNRADNFPIAGATAIVCVAITIEFAILFFLKKKKEAYKQAMGICIAVEAAIMGFLTVQGHWCASFINTNNGLKYNNDIYQLNQQIKKKDGSYFRTWTYNQNESSRNDGMRNSYNGLGCFHSLYNFNVSNFVNWTSIQDGTPFGNGGSWSGCYTWKNPDLDKFLGVKYYFIQFNSAQWSWLMNKTDFTGVTVNDMFEAFQFNVPLNYKMIANPYGGAYKTKFYVVYENQNHSDFAFAFDNLITYDLAEGEKMQSCLEDMPSGIARYVLRNDEMLLEGGIVETSVANKIKEENPSFTVEKGRNMRDLSKSLITNVNLGLYDLQQPLVGDQKCTCYTFFDPGENSWLGDVKALKAEQLTHIDEGLFEKVGLPETENTFYGRYVVAITPKSTETFENYYDPDGYAIYVPYTYHDDYQADFYLVDENHKIITWDRFQDDKYNEGGNRYRTLYVHPKYDSQGNVISPAPRLSKIVAAQRNKHALSTSGFSMLYYEGATEMRARQAHAKQYRITNVKCGTDKWKFDSNFDKKTLIVTQLPFEKGWSVKAKTSDGKTKIIPVISAQGGFASFVGEVGQTSYTLSFFPANYLAGKYMSAVGAVIFLTTFYGYCFLYKNREMEDDIRKELEMN